MDSFVAIVCGIFNLIQNVSKKHVLRLLRTMVPEPEQGASDLNFMLDIILKMESGVVILKSRVRLSSIALTLFHHSLAIAMCEMYGRPAEIYVYDRERGAAPRQTFHSVTGIDHIPPHSA